MAMTLEGRIALARPEAPPLVRECARRGFALVLAEREIAELRNLLQIAVSTLESVSGDDILWKADSDRIHHALEEIRRRSRAG